MAPDPRPGRGLAAGLITGAVAGAIVSAWPVIRAIWWWSPETVITGSLVFGWIELAEHTTLLYRLAFVALIVGVPAAIKPVRLRIYEVLWCLITRHRIRTCFSEFIITNRTGSLPLILWAVPTPVGERIWIWLRPGLCLDDLLNRLDKIAVACWATAATAEAAASGNAAFIRLDIKRRDALTGTITSPLLEVIKGGSPPALRDSAPVPTALDLPEVTASRGHPRQADAHQASRSQDARCGITCCPGPRRHHRLALTASRHPGPATTTGPSGHGLTTGPEVPLPPLGEGEPAMTGPAPATGTSPAGPMLSMFDPIFVGIDEFGHPVRIRVIYKNLLAAGEPGGGKSGLLNTFAAHAALSAGSRLVLFDGKIVELGYFKDVADEFVGADIDHAITTLLRLQKVMDNRYAWLHAHRRRKIEPADGINVIVIIFDEIALYSTLLGTEQQQRQFVALLRDLVARGRAAAMPVIAATQRPSVDIIPKSLRDLFGYRAAFRCTSHGSSDIILGDGWTSAGISATDISPVNPGEAFLIAEGGTPQRIKAPYLTDDDIKALADYAAWTRRTGILAAPAGPAIAVA